jgi:hypothetical protein
MGTIGLASIASHLLLESPTPLIGAVLIAAVFLALSALQARGTSRRGLAVGALAALVAAPLLWLLAATITTERERVMARTMQLLDLTVPIQLPALEGLIKADAEFVSHVGRECFDRARMLGILKRNLEAHRVSAHDVRSLAAQVISDSEAESWLEVRTSFADGSPVGSGPVPSSWQLTWGRRGSGEPWQITRVRCMRLMRVACNCTLW